LVPRKVQPLQVLACILIRLALAECFSVSCGIIALDEPTTNLDMANSSALAEALRSIIDLRHSVSLETGRAFQLVVITHDESFATQLGAREYCESITRVSKNMNCHSVLSTEEIE
jgi:DNA repair protein RAD50